MHAVADTSAILDLVLLRRRAPGTEPAGETGWDRTVEVDVVDETTGEPATTIVNRYFAEHPHHVLGDMVVGQGMYRDGELAVRGDPTTVGDQLTATLRAIVDASPLRYMPPRESPAGKLARRVVQVGDVELRSERTVELRQDNFVVSRTGVIYRHDDGHLVNAEIPKRSTDEVRALIGLRDRTVNLLRLEVDDAPDGDIEAARRLLADAYERYRHRSGPLNRVSWARTGRFDPATGEERHRRIPARLGGFRCDPDWPTLSAIEAYDDDLGVASAAPILRERTIHPPVRRLGADTAEEAVAVSLDETGGVDVDRVADLLGITPDEARTDLEPLVYQDPATGTLVTAEDYLSGDVRAKLVTARAAAARDPGLARNVSALEGVQPAQLRPGEIVVRPGAPWVDTADVADFVHEILGAPDPTVTYTGSLGTWTLEVPAGTRSTVTMTSEWGTSRAPADRLFEGCLNQRLAKVYDDDGDGRRVLNVDETTAAREKQERLAERFSAWIWENPARAERIAERYNALFNSYVAPAYTGEHLTFPGLASTFVPHGHQRAAVARILREGRSLLAHAVGAGRTATMVMAGMEQRRLGLANRPAFVVPNLLLGSNATVLFTAVWLCVRCSSLAR
jgi:N12 class adenine-specific DNA methylase